MPAFRSPRLSVLADCYGCFTGGLDPITDPSVTVSVGLATFPSPQIASADDFVARADEALYRAKANGRNQSVVASIPQLSLVA